MEYSLIRSKKDTNFHLMKSRLSWSASWRVSQRCIKKESCIEIWSLRISYWGISFRMSVLSLILGWQLLQMLITISLRDVGHLVTWHLRFPIWKTNKNMILFVIFSVWVWSSTFYYWENHHFLGHSAMKFSSKIDSVILISLSIISRN